MKIIAIEASDNNKNPYFRTLNYSNQ